MAFPYEISKLFLADGSLFVIQGFLTYMSPSPQRLLKEKVDSKIALPPFKDVRRALGAGAFSMGFMMIAIGYVETKGLELNTLALFRAVTLIPIVYTGFRQIQGKKWKTSGSLIMFVSLYAILALMYVYFGLIDPPTYPNI